MMIADNWLCTKTKNKNKNKNKKTWYEMKWKQIPKAAGLESNQEKHEKLKWWAKY